MTLATQDDVRWTQTANAFERDVLKWFDEDLEAGNQTAKHRANLAGAHALAIDCVVDEVNEQCDLLQTVKLPIESADVNVTAEYRGRRVYIITNLQRADLFAVFSRDRMHPTGFVAEHETAIN